MSEVLRTELHVQAEQSTLDSLHATLRGDILACDCLLSLFWAALNSYRHNSILRPYPPMYSDPDSNRGDKRTDQLRSVFASLPSLDQVLDAKTTLNYKQAELLQWILKPRGFTLEYKPPSTIEHILFHTSALSIPTPATRPQYVFELMYEEDSEERFQSVVSSRGTFYAFHGSSVENFHSILHNGLLNMFNKVSAFGEGTYLSSELTVCLNWSPSGSLWPHSLLPHLASCVAVCEVVKHPSVMSKHARRGSEPNLQNKVPEEYFVVSNDELLRVKYLLLYRRDKKKISVQRQSWIQRNKFLVVIVLYGLLLLVVSALRSNFMFKIYNKYIREF